MVALMYNYGRYLLISSSQPGGQAANLQGVWNDSKNAPWDSKYTINIKYGDELLACRGNESR